MSLDEKIGKLIILGFDGHTMNDHINNLIKGHKIGGVILFGKNYFLKLLPIKHQ